MNIWSTCFEPEAQLAFSYDSASFCFVFLNGVSKPVPPSFRNQTHYKV